MSTTAYATYDDTDDEHVRSPVCWRRRITSDGENDEENVPSPASASARMPTTTTGVSVVSDVMSGEVLVVVSATQRGAVPRLLLFPTVQTLRTCLHNAIDSSYQLGEVNFPEDMQLWTCIQRTCHLTVDKSNAAMKAAATALCERLQLATHQGFGIAVVSGDSERMTFYGSPASAAVEVSLGAKKPGGGSGVADAAEPCQSALDRFLCGFLASLVQLETPVSDELLAGARPKIIIYVQ